MARVQFPATLVPFLQEGVGESPARSVTAFGQLVAFGILGAHLVREVTARFTAHCFYGLFNLHGYYTITTLICQAFIIEFVFFICFIVL